MSKRYKELEKVTRRHWNEFDPIGVVDLAEVDDEYYSYLPQTIKLIMIGADEHAFYEHIEQSVYVNMGLSGIRKYVMRDFAQKLAAIAAQEVGAAQ